MPLVRFPVRNEYRLGNPELYGEEERDDPKAMLQGVAVAGLVGILRQLGDLAEFAAEVFHGLQEEVTITSSRSRKLMSRVQRIEAALPQLENSILAQKSHLHFAYTAGSVWRAHARLAHNHFIHGDLPEFIMNSYEECSDPPRLHSLDKFDSGGPGSCLKRYSDPTFFKKASALSSQSNGQKSSKSRKSNRIKKKRVRQRTLSTHDPSVSNHTDRPQFASPQAGVRISLSPSHTISTYDGTIKSDQEEQTNTFDLRTDSNYIECVFHPTDPIKPEENEPEKVSFSSSQILPENSIFNLASVDECTRVINDDNFGESPLEEQIRESLSSVSWEEKEEIVEPTVLQDEHLETAEIIGTDFIENAEEKGEVISNNGCDFEFSVDNEGLFTSVSNQICPNDLDSEPDDFVDALNTIESESETDTDFHTKREVEKSFNLNIDMTENEIQGQIAHCANDLPPNETKQEVEQSFNNYNDERNDGMDELLVENSDIQFSNSEFRSVAHIDLNEEPSSDNPESSQFHEHEELPNNKSIIENEKTGNLCNLSGAEEANQQNLVNNEVQNESSESQINSKENSGVQSVHFWTNGGLLGLEPSKPPVFVAPNTKSESSENSLPQNNIVKTGKYAGKPDELVQSSEMIERNSSKCSTSYRDESNAISDKKTSWRFLSAVLDTKREKNSYFQISNSFNSNLAQSFGKFNGIIPKNEQNISSDGRALCNETSQGDISNGSHISVLSNRIPLNDFQRSLVNNRTFNGNYRNGSPLDSPSSSPPLQHMKISFQPGNYPGNSKLKLKFPEGSFGHESGTYMLPSFQLVPELASSHQDIGSESDNDTFCRSSPYMSDDRHENESESDSEQWDSEDNHNDTYDGMRNISLKENVSSSTDTGEIRQENTDVDYGFQSSYGEKSSEPSQVYVPDLPSLGAMNPLFEQEMKILSDGNYFPKSQFSEEHTPQPPPFPPSEWQNIKPKTNVIIANQESNFEDFDRGNDLKLFGSIDTQQSNTNLINKQTLNSPVISQSNPNSVKQQLETDEAVTHPPRREPEERSSSGKKEVNQIRKGMVVDEKDDFLHQIRTKSFNLRRTGNMMEKPNVTTGLATNAKVTAILEKANAIRQAVGSDDGDDDDSWSEA